MCDFMVRLAELDLVWTLPLADGGCFSLALLTSEVRLPPVRYMDDTSVPVKASSAVELVGKIVLVVNTL